MWQQQQQQQHEGDDPHHPIHHLGVRPSSTSSSFNPFAATLFLSSSVYGSDDALLREPLLTRADRAAATIMTRTVYHAVSTTNDNNHSDDDNGDTSPTTDTATDIAAASSFGPTKVRNGQQIQQRQVQDASMDDSFQDAYMLDTEQGHGGIDPIDGPNDRDQVLTDHDDNDDEGGDEVDGLWRGDGLSHEQQQQLQQRLWSCSGGFHILLVWIQTPWFPDDAFHLYNGGVRLLDGPVTVKLLKFTSMTFLTISAVHWFVRWMEWEHDEKLQLSDVWVYEGNLIALDIVFFFVVGRLHQQPGIDHVAWIGMVLLANLYNSYLTTFPFLQHSVTLYEMHCLWPWKLWAFVGIVTPVILLLVFLHIQRAVQDHILAQKLVELALTFLFLLAPLLTSPYFHLHHWYAGWLVGMHCNFADAWWSRAAMAWCWGAYINGIAVYGRDPVLTCGYAYFISIDQRCPFVQCYLDGLKQLDDVVHSNITHPFNITVTPMIPPNWRNCSVS